MAAIQVRTWIRLVAEPITCAEVMVSLLTSVVKIGSKLHASPIPRPSLEEWRNATAG